MTYPTAPCPPSDLTPFLASLGTDAASGVAFLDTEGRFIFVSEGLAQLNGVPAAEHLGRTVAEVLPSVWPLVAEAQASALRGEPVRFQFTAATPADPGRPRTWEESWSPVYEGERLAGIAVTVADVSELRAAQEREREFAARQASLRSIANAALSDAPIGEVFAAALEALRRHLRAPFARAMRIAGGSDQLVVFAEAGWDRDLQEAHPIGPRRGSFGDYVLSHRATVQFEDLGCEHRFRRPARFLAHGIRSGIGTRISAGERVWGHLGAYDRRVRQFDCDEVAFIEEIAAILGLVVQERDSRAFREEVLSMASHQLRTPLTSVIGLAQHLQRRVARGATETVPDLLDLLVAEAFRLNEVLEQWNELAAAESYRAALTCDPVDVARVVAGCVEQFRSRYPEMHVVERYPEPAPMIASDAQRIGEIIDNLLENGRKYGGGEIEVSVERVAGGVALHCLDHGPGVPPEIAPFIFDRFFRGAATAGHPGMGLGLDISRMLAEGLGGTLDVTGGPGEGARFTLLLPEQPRVPPEPRHDAHAEVSG